MGVKRLRKMAEDICMGCHSEGGSELLMVDGKAA
jgi:hypothetical protein